MIRLVIAITICAGIAFLIYNKGLNDCENSERIRNQAKEIEITKDVVAVKDFQQKILHQAFDKVDIAARNNWLQLICEERGINCNR